MSVRKCVVKIIDIFVDVQKQNHTWLEKPVKEFLQANDKQSNVDKKKVREQRKDVLQVIQDIINELVEPILKIESASDQVSEGTNSYLFDWFSFYVSSSTKKKRWWTSSQSTHWVKGSSTMFLDMCRPLSNIWISNVHHTTIISSYNTWQRSLSSLFLWWR